jgi:hypothetical protein
MRPASFIDQMPANAGGRRNIMSDNYIIEIRPMSGGVSVQAGIVVRDGSSFRFFAATHAFNSLDGQYFKTPRAAERAAVRRIARLSQRNTE